MIDVMIVGTHDRRGKVEFAEWFFRDLPFWLFLMHCKTIVKESENSALTSIKKNVKRINWIGVKWFLCV
jgi:hypothetical protein